MNNDFNINIEEPIIAANLDEDETNIQIDDAMLEGGAVNSVNGKTGDVLLDAEDVGAVPVYQGPYEQDALYGIDENGAQKMLPLSEDPLPNNVPIRSDNGTLKGESPIDDDDLTTKEYVDDKNDLQDNAIERLEEENLRQAFEIADLKNIVYDTVVEDIEHKFENLNVASLPTHISDGTNYHKVFEGSELMFASMLGKTVKWNQHTDFATISTTTINGITFTVNNDKTITLNGTSTDVAQIQITADDCNISSGHKIFISTGLNHESSIRIRVYKTGTITLGDIFTPNIVTYSNNIALGRLRVPSGVTLENITVRLAIVDLTDMYGAGNEPTTVAQFLADYPAYNGYVPYNEGTMKSVQASGMKVNGANLWDEEWERGLYDSSTGKKVGSSAGGIRSVGKIVVKEGYSIFSSAPTKKTFYDENENYIGYIASAVNPCVVPTNAKYMGFNTPSEYGFTYNHDIAIILGTSGTYKPHRPPFILDFGQTVTLDGVSTAKDEVRAVKQTDGTWNLELAKRMWEVDLGTLDWTRTNAFGTGKYVFKASQPSHQPKEIAASVVPNIACDKYLPLSADVISSVAHTNIGITYGYNGWHYEIISIFVYDPSYTDPTVFKSAMNGVYLVYEVATPIVTTLCTGLTEIDIATLTEKYGSIEVVGNVNEGFSRPSVSVIMQVEKAVEV